MLLHSIHGQHRRLRLSESDRQFNATGEHDSVNSLIFISTAATDAQWLNPSGQHHSHSIRVPNRANSFGSTAGDGWSLSLDHSLRKPSERRDRPKSVQFVNYNLLISKCNATFNWRFAHCMIRIIMRTAQFRTLWTSESEGSDGSFRHTSNVMVNTHPWTHTEQIPNVFAD